MPGRNPAIDRCVEVLARSRSVVVSTGAGISKESGIPTFRDAPNALWANFDPETLATPEGFRQNPSLVWRWYGERRSMISNASPNKGHEALAEGLEGIVRIGILEQHGDEGSPLTALDAEVHLHGPDAVIL